MFQFLLPFMAAAAKAAPIAAKVAGGAAKAGGMMAKLGKFGSMAAKGGKMVTPFLSALNGQQEQGMDNGFMPYQAGGGGQIAGLNSAAPGGFPQVQRPGMISPYQDMLRKRNRFPGFQQAQPPYDSEGYLM